MFSEFGLDGELLRSCVGKIAELWQLVANVYSSYNVL